MPFMAGRGIAANTYPVAYTDGSGQVVSGQELSGDALSTSIQNLQAQWYVNYLPTTNAGYVGRAQFLPMFFDGTYVTAPNLAAAAAYNPPVILGFNEPNNVSPQANMTAAQALALWPQLEALGIPLGSPSTGQPYATSTSGGAVGDPGWLEAFMAGDGHGYVPRVDYITWHYYSSAFSTPTGVATNIATNAASIAAKYPGKPILITELGYIGFSGGVATWTFPTPAQFLALMGAVEDTLRRIRTASNVVGWFAYPNALMPGLLAEAPNYANVQLSNLDGSLTTAGVAYSKL